MWTEKEEAIVRERYLLDGPTALGRQLRRTANSVRQKANRLGVDTQPKGREWTTEEVALVRARYALDGPSALGKQINRSASSVQYKANHLGLIVDPTDTPWTAKEEALMRRLYPSEGATAVAELIDRCPTTVRIWARKMGLHYDASKKVRVFRAVETKPKEPSPDILAKLEAFRAGTPAERRLIWAMAMAGELR